MDTATHTSHSSHSHVQAAASLPYARIDVPDNRALGSGSYLRLGGYVEDPDKTLLNTFKNFIVQTSTSSSQEIADPAAEARTKGKQITDKDEVSVSYASVKPNTSGLLLKTDKAMYVSVEDAALSNLGYQTTHVTKGDSITDVQKGAFYAIGNQGVSISAGDASTMANIVMEATGYIKQTAHGPSDDWTYGDKTSRTKGNTTSYYDGESYSYYTGYQYSENKGTKDAYIYGVSNSVLFGMENAMKMSGKSELIIGASIALNIAVSLKIVLGGEVKIAFPYDVKIVFNDIKVAMTDSKFANLDVKYCTYDAKLGLFDTECKTLKTQEEVLKQRTLSCGMQTAGIKLINAGLNVWYNQLGMMP